ncbi:MAG: hypothetical protein IKU81_01490 [Oscillibacter sp.]|nr:hypothetical protein [Oscillibacter sp.]
MKHITEILNKYTRGEATLAETNTVLQEMRANIRLDEKKNIITKMELAGTTVGELPEEVHGFGLLDTGTGSYDKVEVRAGRLVEADCGDMVAFCLIGGKTYRVCGDKLEA